MDEQAERDKLIEIGLRWEEFFVSFPGKFLLERLQQRIGETVHDQNWKRIQIDDKNWDFACTDLGHFERHRGFMLGVKWVNDMITSTINAAKRNEEERKQSDQES